MAPRADMFDKTTFVVAAGATTDPSALELAANFVESIGAQPLFMDPVEHDGLIAGVEQLPQLLGLATVHMLAAAPGWTEARRLAGRTFAQSTDSGRSAENLYAAMRGNRANLLMRLEQFERELAAWKAWLTADGDANGDADGGAGDETADHPLQAAIADSRAERERWVEQAQLHDWAVGEPVIDAGVTAIRRLAAPDVLWQLGLQKRSRRKVLAHLRASLLDCWLPFRRHTWPTETARNKLPGLSLLRCCTQAQVYGQPSSIRPRSIWSPGLMSNILAVAWIAGIFDDDVVVDGPNCQHIAARGHIIDADAAILVGVERDITLRLVGTTEEAGRVFVAVILDRRGEIRSGFPESPGPTN